jgi:hypothetical protein
MIKTIAKLRAPWFGGKLTLVFASNFRRIRPETRMHLLNQAMQQLRAEHDLAASHHRIERRDEDARNAEAATLRGEPETATS